MATKNTPAFEAGKYYKVDLSQAVTLMPGVILRPGVEHRIEGSLLGSDAFAGKILKAVEEAAPASE